ncbi:TetR/AcrR family transcriptional regulator [Massilia atriviolacea]|uniref:TetR/AcrR family transcriptional regulator n=1 Tax=Massilia atriviolacea TaxID=2495579 RepID=A0A430HCY2_9BURK|nr:TetR/AcrR family transcriptional regulator [Massilia atriviolacea]RSZ55398.1 TetR/AcrR family transcriptional regulator [Massilia atriviolacea]
MQCPLEMKPRWERRKDARPQELLAAALDLFVERGFASTRLEDVAKRAGVSKGTLYLYFTNKEELFKAVVRDTIVPALGAAEDMIASFEGSSADLLRAVMQAWWANAGATKSSGMIKLVMAEAGNFPDIAVFYREEVILRGTSMISGLLERAVERGEFRPLDVFLTTQTLIAPVLMLMLWKHSVGPCEMSELDPVAFIDSFLTMTLSGLLPRAP